MPRSPLQPDVEKWIRSCQGRRRLRRLRERQGRRSSSSPTARTRRPQARYLHQQPRGEQPRPLLPSPSLPSIDCPLYLFLRHRSLLKNLKLSVSVRGLHLQFGVAAACTPCTPHHLLHAAHTPCSFLAQARTSGAAASDPSLSF